MRIIIREKDDDRDRGENFRYDCVKSVYRMSMRMMSVMVMMIVVMMDLNDDTDDCADRDNYVNVFDDGDGSGDVNDDGVTR
jgi:hypothetical protein